MSDWMGRKVLVTGADGFIGSHLVERLVLEGAQVRAFVLYNPLGWWGSLEDIPTEVRDAVEVIPGDVRDAEVVNGAARDCEVIFHLAALNAIPYSYQAVESFIDTNVRGTLNVLKAALEGNAGLLIHTSTSEVYGSARTVPIRETHPLQAQSPYAASKIGADKLAESFHCSFDLPVTILRPFNTYGPRQSARAVIPTILAQLLSGYREVHLGSLEPRRDFTYVTDTVDGFLRVGRTPEHAGRTIQLGTGRDISIRELFDLAVKVVGAEAVVTTDAERVRPTGSEVIRLLSDPSVARELTGWEPTVSLEDGLRRTAEFVRSNLHRFKVSTYNI